MEQVKARFVISFLFLPMLFMAGACGGGDSQVAASRGREGGAANLPVKQVKLTQSEARRLTQTVTAPGTLAADEQAALSFKVAGRVDAILVDLGSPVRKGQVIANLETTEFKVRLQQAEAALQQARARLGLPPQGADDAIEAENTSLARQARAVLEEAKSNRERVIQLVNQGIQSKAELDRVDSTFKVAESRYQDAIEEVRNRQAILLQRRSELAIAQQQLVETTLYAPFDGAVRERRASLGEYLNSGAPVVTIVRLHPLRLRVEVPEREAQGIKINQPVSVLVEGDNQQSYSGRVARLSPAFQEQSRTLIIEAEVDNRQGKLRPGSFAKAEIQTTATSDVVMVPASAIVTFAGIQKVFSVKDGKALEKNVVVGKRPEGQPGSQEGWVVVEGLDAGAPVVLSPGNLVSGQPVSISQ
ncbi:MAG TPA: efflux RND transporter periplasmic adaptor subunit [Blastocatellia bacterium]|nr:efflux RND transporter periplasmic adaptor subunit [Blastocatellia bacterium]